MIAQETRFETADFLPACATHLRRKPIRFCIAALFESSEMCRHNSAMLRRFCFALLDAI
jgi:hypothetical protein